MWESYPGSSCKEESGHAQMMGWLIALLMMCGSAVAEQAALPWSMTWETTPAGCVQALEANMGEGCTIVALRDGSVQIDLTTRQGGVQRELPGGL